jgi:hypothetical protein
LTATFLLAGGAVTLRAGSQVLGQINLIGATKAERASGVWIDGEYLGYLKELKGSRQILLLPGKHDIVVRQNGYQDFRESVTVEPGQTLDVPVAMHKDPQSQFPAVYSQLKLAVDPERAAVFVDGRYVGHAGEFGGMGRAMLLAPGKHEIKIDLAGYRSFETEVNLLPREHVDLKTNLLKGSIAQADPLIRTASR